MSAMARSVAESFLHEFMQLGQRVEAASSTRLEVLGAPAHPFAIGVRVVAELDHEGAVRRESHPSWIVRTRCAQWNCLQALVPISEKRILTYNTTCIYVQRILTNVGR